MKWIGTCTLHKQNKKGAIYETSHLIFLDEKLGKVLKTDVLGAGICFLQLILLGYYTCLQKHLFRTCFIGIFHERICEIFKGSFSIEKWGK